MHVLTRKMSLTAAISLAVSRMGATLSVLLIVPSAAHANMGLPMVAVFLPPMWLALVPIILAEAFVVARSTATPFGRTLGGTAVANVVSTILGVPLLWCILAGIQGALFGTAIGLQSFWTKLYAVTVQSPWLIPYEDEFYWMIPSALAVLAVPFFLLSVFVEAPIVRKIARLGATAYVTRTIVLANLVSYVGLGLVIAVIQYFDWNAILWGGPFEPVTHWLIDIAFRIAAMIARQP